MTTPRRERRTAVEPAAAQKEAVRFSIGINYWPRRSALAMWERFDSGEIDEDFARIAALELDTVRFFIRWDQFQPQADRVDATMLDRLERCVTLAAERGLRTVPTLFCGYMHGANWLPGWALDRNRSAGAIPTYADGIAVVQAAGDIYGGTLLDAQRTLARAVGTRLRGHPGVYAWDIGHAFSNVREPAHEKVSSGDHGSASAAEPYLAQWSRCLNDTLHEASGCGVTAGTFEGDLTRDRDVRLGSLCAPFAFASMQGGPVHSGFARDRLDPEVVPFLAMLTAGLSYKPVMVSGFGSPTCPPHKFSLFERFAQFGEAPLEAIAADDPVLAGYPCLREDEAAAYCTSVLERLHADGRLGAYWWCWADYPQPFMGPAHERSYGIIRSDGTQKPVAAALAAFARQRRSVQRARDMPMISSTYYYRTLPLSTQTLYDAFLGFVAERRIGLAER